MQTINTYIPPHIPHATSTKSVTTVSPDLAPAAAPSANSSGAARELAEGLIAQIRAIWPGQTKNWLPGQLLPAWTVVLAHELRGEPAMPVRLVKALRELQRRPYPPDLGALLATACDADDVSDADAASSFQRVLRAVGVMPPAYHQLSPTEFAAVQALGTYRLRTASGDSIRAEFSEALRSAARRHDLPAPPPAPAGLLRAKGLSREEARDKLRQLREAFPALR